jgi:hypothetical protein
MLERADMKEAIGLNRSRLHSTRPVFRQGVAEILVLGDLIRAGQLLCKRVLGNSKCRPLILLGETCVSENPGKWRCLFPQFTEAQKSTVQCWFRRFSPYCFHAGSQGRRRGCDFSRGSHDRIGTYGVFPNTLCKYFLILFNLNRLRFADRFF